MPVSQPPSTTPAGLPPPAVATALLERHQAGLRTYLTGLHGAVAARVEIVLKEIMGEAPAQMQFEEDPAVWMFTEGRRRVVSGSHPGDVLVGDPADGARDDDM